LDFSKLATSNYVTKRHSWREAILERENRAGMKTGVLDYTTENRKSHV